MGGQCIYCGQEGSKDHLDECAKYKQAKEVGEEDEESPFINGNNKRPPPETPLERVLPQRDNKEETNTLQLEQKIHRVTPATNTYKKTKPATDQSHASDKLDTIANCLACRQPNCPHEQGFSSLSEGEFDPNEAPPGFHNPDKCWTLDKSNSFDSMTKLMRSIVGGLMCFNHIWSRHKFIGTPALDLLLKTWMKVQRKMDPKIVEENWSQLRRTAKETFRQRRENCIEDIKRTFFGECCHSEIDDSLFSPTILLTTPLLWPCGKT